MTLQSVQKALASGMGIHSYVQSVEKYKGFELVIVMQRFDTSRSLQYHRSCHIYKDGECIGIDKTKKSAKDLIDHDCFKEVKR